MLTGCLRFYDWRDDVFGRTFVDAMPQGAVVNAVKKIDSQPNGEPPEETNPRFERQAAHKGQAHDYAQDWEQWNERNTKGPSAICIGAAQDYHAQANENEGK